MVVFFMLIPPLKPIITNRIIIGILVFLHKARNFKSDAAWIHSDN
jgi:hypothetical protein